jgi:sugar phosphate isomerase/epimerase
VFSKDFEAAVMLLSLPHLNMLDATPPEVVRAAADAGFDAVCLRLFPTMPGERQHPMIGDTAMMRETRALLDDTGVKVLDIEAVWLKPETRAENYVSGFEAAAKLGARVIQAIGDDADEGRLVDTYGAMCAAAAPFGLTVDLEYMAGATTNRLDKALHVVTKAAPANGGLLIDCLHMNRCGTKPEELLTVEPELIHVFQLCDGDLKAPGDRDAANHEARYNRLLPGEGAFDLTAIWAHLPPTVDVSVEVPMRDRTANLNFAERARMLKESADAFLAREGDPGRARLQ